MKSPTKTFVPIDKINGILCITHGQLEGQKFHMENNYQQNYIHHHCNNKDIISVCTFHCQRQRKGQKRVDSLHIEQRIYKQIYIQFKKSPGLYSVRGNSKEKKNKNVLFQSQEHQTNENPFMDHHIIPNSFYPDYLHY